MKFIILTIITVISSSTFAGDSCLQLFVTSLQNYIPTDSRRIEPQPRTEASTLSLEQALKHYRSKAIVDYKHHKYDDPEAFKTSITLFEKHKADFLRLAQTIKAVAATNGKVIIGIGGSPSPVMSLFKLNDVQAAISLPVSVPYLPKNKIDIGAKRLREAHRIFTAEQIQILFDLWKVHFKDVKSLPSNILLVDYADSGNTIDYVRKLLLDFFRLHFGLEAQIDVLTFQYGPSPFSIPIANSDKLYRTEKGGYVHWSYALPYDLYHAFQSQKFKALSEWPSFVPGLIDIKTVKRREQNQIFLNYLAERKSTHLIE